MNMTALYSCFGVIFGLLCIGLLTLGILQQLLNRKRREFEASKRDIAGPAPLEVCAEDVLIRIKNAEIDAVAPLGTEEAEACEPNF